MLLALFGLGDDSSDDAGTIGEVMDDTHVRKACLAAELGSGVEGSLRKSSQAKQAAGAQHVRRRIEQAAEDVEAVGTALERQVGLKVP